HRGQDGRAKGREGGRRDSSEDADAPKLRLRETPPVHEVAHLPVRRNRASSAASAGPAGWGGMVAAGRLSCREATGSRRFHPALLAHTAAPLTLPVASLRCIPDGASAYAPSVAIASAARCQRARSAAALSTS